MNNKRLTQAVLLVIPVLHLFLFGLLPLYGITLAFKDFSFARGLFSPWNGLENFRILFRDDIQVLRILVRTVSIGAGRVVLLFFVPLAFVLVLDTLPWERFKIRVLLFLLFPQFISWVVTAGIILISFSSGAFEAVFNLYNPALYPYVDIVDTYVYRTGIAAGRFSLAAAIELLKNGINFLPALLFFVFVYRRMTQRRHLW